MVRSEWVDSSSSTCSWKKQYVMELIARRLPLFYSQIHNRQDCSQWSSQNLEQNWHEIISHFSLSQWCNCKRKNRTLFCIHAQFQPPKIHLIFTRMDHRLIWLWPIYVIIRWRTRRCASRRVTRILLLLLLLLCRLVSVLHYFFIKCRKRLFSFLPLLKSHWLDGENISQEYC